MSIDNQGSGGREAFAERRSRFAQAIGEGAIAVLPSAPVSVRSNDVDYVYRQDSDFYYLTGFSEPESAAVFAPGNPDGAFLMFVQPRDRERETWTGRRAGVEGAMTGYGADKAYRSDELDAILPRLLEKVERVYYPLGLNERMNERMLRMIRGSQAMRPRTGSGPGALIDPREILHEMRLFKRPEELSSMRRAMAISDTAHRRAMAQARGGMFEWQLEAVVDYTFRSSGAKGPSYPSIIASGPNATILHHINNDREMSAGELLLIDAGAEYDYYAADVTRTFPIAGRFSPAQRAVYDIVLEAQLRAIDSVRPGVRFEEVHETALKVLVEGMRSLKLVKEGTDEALKLGSYRRYYMHRTSHWLGMDVHDVGLYRVGGDSRRLEPGMVMTVEPGLYIAADDEDAPAELRGTGVRIEDDVLVTAEGRDVMTAAVPKRVAEVEAITAG